jgi:hypothetical protein
VSVPLLAVPNLVYAGLISGSANCAAKIARKKSLNSTVWQHANASSVVRGTRYSRQTPHHLPAPAARGGRPFRSVSTALHDNASSATKSTGPCAITLGRSARGISGRLQEGPKLLMHRLSANRLCEDLRLDNPIKLQFEMPHRRCSLTAEDDLDTE